LIGLRDANPKARCSAELRVCENRPRICKNQLVPTPEQNALTSWL
jgi:hypothetical protein